MMSSPSLFATCLNTPIFRSLRHYFANHPVKSQSVLAGAIWAIGDIMSQKLIESKDCSKGLNWKRVGTMVAYGTCIQGPLNFHWYTRLNRWVQCEKKSKEILSKVVIDQIFMGPTNLLIFIAVVTGIEKMRLSAIKEKVRQNFLDMLAVDISIWPLIQTLNFTFVQPRFQSVVVNTVSVIYNSILTYLLHGNQSYLQFSKKKENPSASVSPSTKS